MSAKILLSTALMFTMTAPAFAQNRRDEAELKYFFEGRRVVLRMDMPGTKDGVNVYPDRRSVDFSQYRYDLRRYGAALRAGDSAMVTLVKVKGDLIEFQLDGGGFGTFFDDTDTSVNVPLLPKSGRERELERLVRDENDRYRLNQMRRELDNLRDRRERENRRIMIERERLAERKRDRVAINRLNGGSRFNLRFPGGVPYDLRPEDIMSALAEFVDFRGRGGR
jgi:hypothetical protein